MADEPDRPEPPTPPPPVRETRAVTPRGWDAPREWILNPTFVRESPN